MAMKPRKIRLSLENIIEENELATLSRARRGMAIRCTSRKNGERARRLHEGAAPLSARASRSWGRLRRRQRKDRGVHHPAQPRHFYVRQVARINYNVLSQPSSNHL